MAILKHDRRADLARRPVCPALPGPLHEGVAGLRRIAGAPPPFGNQGTSRPSAVLYSSNQSSRDRRTASASDRRAIRSGALVPITGRMPAGCARSQAMAIAALTTPCAVAMRSRAPPSAPPPDISAPPPSGDHAIAVIPARRISERSPLVKAERSCRLSPN